MAGGQVEVHARLVEVPGSAAPPPPRVIHGNFVNCQRNHNVTDNSDQLCFDRNFQFGVATAAFQIEGGWNASGKGESIWDRYTHEHPERIADRKNADVAADSYHKFREDVLLMRELGVSLYRLSISWPRIMPDGSNNNINRNGIRYYKRLLDELNRNNIEAIVTMYHWDLPQALEDLGGWINPIMADYFVNYTRVLFQNFGSRVKTWITFNEPVTFCHEGYGGLQAPGHQSSGVEDYLCGHTVLRAHGKVYRMYKRVFAKANRGRVGITMNMPWIEPVSSSDADDEAAETARQFLFGWFANPIFTTQGDYPPIMRSRIDANSRQQNFSESRLPSFTKAEIRNIRGSYDFLGLNHYSTYLAEDRPQEINSKPDYYNDIGIGLTVDPTWPTSNSSWLWVVPWGFRKALNWIKDTYDNPQVLITENGISEKRGLNDTKRIDYIDSYLRSMHSAIYEDECYVIGYMYWSLMDNYEWLSGYTERFGLHEVDFSSRRRTRTARRSARYYTQLANTGCLPDKNLP